MPSQPDPEWITYDEAARLSGRQYPTILGWLKHGWLKSRCSIFDCPDPKRGGRKRHLYVRRDEVLAVVERIGPREMQGPRYPVEVPLAEVLRSPVGGRFEAAHGAPVESGSDGETEYMRWNSAKWAIRHHRVEGGRVFIDAGEWMW